MRDRLHLHVLRAADRLAHWAEEVDSLTKIYPAAEKIILVCDNLITHFYGSLYDGFSALKAREISHRIDLRNVNSAF